MTTRAERQRRSAPSKWYVARTHFRAEVEAAKAIRAEGIRCYLPMWRDIRRVRSGRREERREIETPAFPNYVFVRLENEGQYHAVKALASIRGFLGPQGGKPVRMEERILRKIRLAAAAGFYDKRPRAVVLREGQPLRICHGPFTGYKAKFLSRRADERVEVLMQALMKGGREYPVLLDMADIEVENAA